ncbi:MAG TPA: (Fe-S)-binding protein [Candidatus Nanopelagicaceae bacterium]|nr:(Fe-S)-binding protein [Candidatus Nanopelagicaceae bacterium]
MTSYINNEIKSANFSSQVLEQNTKNIISMANYCYACNRCVNVCPLAHLDLFYPRNLVGDLVFFSIGEVLKKHNIWNCLTCGQCTIYCPMSQENEGVRIPELILELRKISINNNSELDKIAKCETHGETFPLISRIMANNQIQPDKLDFLRESHLKTTISGEIAYFVGCLPLMEDIFYKFDIKYSSIPKTIVGMLNECGIDPVVLNEKCCGHDVLWGIGDIETFKKLAEYNVKLYKDAGVKTIIVSCAEGYRTWKFDYPRVIKDFNFEVLHFSEFFLKEKILENFKFPRKLNIKVTYHDSCRLGRLGGKLYDAPRELIKSIPGIELIEMENIKDDANCCGVSAFTGCNEFTHFLRQNRINEAANTGADYLIVPCPKCLTHFNCYLSELSLNNEHNELRNKIKVVDLASFIGKLLMLV